MKKLAIIGAGDLGKQLAHLAISDNQFEVVGFFDDTKNDNELINGILVLGCINSVEKYFLSNCFDVLLIAIGYEHMNIRKYIYNRFRDIIPFAKLIHSTAIIDSTAVVKEGVVIYPGCLLDKNVVIDENVLLNLHCTIAHDTSVGSHSFLSPSVVISGFCNIGAQNVLGVNSTIIDNIITADEVQLGGGTVVINNIGIKGLYVGNPSRFIR